MNDDDNLIIPDFLDRKKTKFGPNQPAKVYAMPITPSAWERVKQQRKVKSRGRVAKMLALKAEREARKAGKTWDIERGGWK